PARASGPRWGRRPRRGRASWSPRRAGRRRGRRARPETAPPGRSPPAPRPRRRTRPPPRRSASAPLPRAELRLRLVVETLSGRARELFAPLGPTYDRYARLLSFGQDPRWRRFLVSRLPVGPQDVVLDVATGTASVALELIRQKGCSVVGVDQSGEMLDEARRRLLFAAETKRVRLVEASANELPFEDASFDGLTA